MLPLIDKIYARKKKKLELTTLKPWDTEAEPAGVLPLKPFTSGQDLYEKTVTCLSRWHSLVFFSVYSREKDMVSSWGSDRGLLGDF